MNCGDVPDTARGVPAAVSKGCMAVVQIITDSATDFEPEEMIECALVSAGKESDGTNLGFSKDI